MDRANFISGCYGSMDESTKVISSPGYPMYSIPRNLQCAWKISEPAGSKINISFPNIINIYDDDYLYVRNF